MDKYQSFIESKSQMGSDGGFEPLWMPEFLFPFQAHLVGWGIRKGRSAIFADCVTSDTIIHSPDGARSIGDLERIGKLSRVFSISDTGPVIAEATAPWVNGFGDVFEIVLASGRTIKASANHRFISSRGWTCVSSLRTGEFLLVSDACRLLSISDNAPTTRGEDDRSFSQTIPDSKANCSAGPCPCDELLQSLSNTVRDASPSPADAPERNLFPWQKDVLEYTRKHTRLCQYTDLPSMTDFPLATETRSSVVSEDHILSERQKSPCDSIQGISLSQLHDSHEGTSRESLQFLEQKQAFSYWDSITAIRYAGKEKFYDIHVPGTENYLANEIWSHNCGLGKTAMQLVWAQNVVEKTDGKVLILTPLAVGAQTVAEAKKFGIDARRSRDGSCEGRITVTNYEKLHLFDPRDFSGVAADESSIIKHATGATQKAVTRFMLKLPYRSLWTATAAPNDFTELGTSSEALGDLNNSEMLTRFFKQMDQKTTDQYEKKINNLEKQANHFGKISFRVSQAINGWRLKGHSHDHFWRWVCSWARACRKPSDVGFSDDGYVLPELIEREHVVIPTTPPDGMLFTMPAFGLAEERDERRRTLKERCRLVADLVAHDKPAVVWCHMNSEGDELERMISNSVQVKGAMEDDEKESAYEQFTNQERRVLICKPKIGAWGLNWQFCNHVVTFASHSYEQYYQSIRRCWRFGQVNPVTVDIIASEGEQRVRDNMTRKAHQAEKMFEELIKHMNNSLKEKRAIRETEITAPSWI